MHNYVYLAQRRSQEFSCVPNFGGRPPGPFAGCAAGLSAENKLTDGPKNCNERSHRKIAPPPIGSGRPYRNQWRSCAVGRVDKVQGRPSAGSPEFHVAVA